MNVKMQAVVLGLSVLNCPPACFSQADSMPSISADVDQALTALQQAGANVQRNRQGDVVFICMNGSGEKFAGEDVKSLAPLTTVEVFDPSCTDMSDEGMALIAGWKRLRVLNLTGTKVTDQGIAHVAQLTELEHLLLPGAATDNCLRHLRGLSKLQLLGLRGTQTTEAALADLQGLERLAYLFLNSDLQLSPAGLASLQEITSLRLVTIPNAFPDEDLTHLKKLRHLDTLHLAECTGITDQGLVHLKELLALRTISLPDRITDKGLAHLADLRDIESLDLRRTRVTGDGLKYLQGMANLKSGG